MGGQNTFMHDVARAQLVWVPCKTEPKGNGSQLQLEDGIHESRNVSQLEWRDSIVVGV